MGWVAFFVVLEDIDGGKAMPVETNHAVKSEAAIAHANTPVKKRVFSGIQPTGNLHLGNYLGALRNWEETQANYDNIFCIVGLHPRYCKLFVQSYVRQHAEMSWIMECFTPMGWLNRMTQFKVKSGENPEAVGAGLYCYPVLMACDILLYQTDYVPVGDDQRQHIEFTRDLAQRFNSFYGEQVFTIPEGQIREVGARIMALDDPTKKMSKSDPNPNSRINLLDDPKTIKQKIARATTDSLRLITFDPERPGIYNLLTIYQALTEQSQQEIEAEFAGKGYGDFKAALTERLVATLVPIQERYRELMSDLPTLESILRQSADEIRPIAEATLQHVKDVIGVG